MASAVVVEELPLTKKSQFKVPRLQEAGLLVVIFILGLTFTIAGFTSGKQNAFLNLPNLLNSVATPASVYAIMAVGVTCVIITGGIDISVGSIFALSQLGAAYFLQELPNDAPAWKVLGVAILVGPGIGLLCGLLNGALVTGLRMHPFIVTLGTLSIFRGIANVTTRIKTLPSQGRTLPSAYTTELFQRLFFKEPNGAGGVRVMPLVMTVIVVLIGWFYLRLTIGGRELYAVGGNEEAARFSGLRVKLIKLRVYAISGLAAGVAGFVSLGRFGTVSTNTGTGYELTVIAAAVVGGASLTGGRGTALGALLGALIIRMIESGIYTPLHWPQEYSQIIIGSAIIVAVAVDRLSEFFRDRRLKRIGRG